MGHLDARRLSCILARPPQRHDQDRRAPRASDTISKKSSQTCRASTKWRWSASTTRCWARPSRPSSSPRAGATRADERSRRIAAQRLATYKVPKYVEFVDALPRTASGKIRRVRTGGQRHERGLMTHTRLATSSRSTTTPRPTASRSACATVTARRAAQARPRRRDLGRHRQLGRARAGGARARARARLRADAAGAGFLGRQRARAAASSPSTSASRIETHRHRAGARRRSAATPRATRRSAARCRNTAKAGSSRS